MVVPDGLNHVRLQWLANGKQFVFSGTSPARAFASTWNRRMGARPSQLVQRELMIPFQLHLIASLQPQLAPMGTYVYPIVGRRTTPGDVGGAGRSGDRMDSGQQFFIRFPFRRNTRAGDADHSRNRTKKAVERPRASGLCGTHKSARPPHGRRRQELRLRVCQNAVGSISRGRIAIAAESSGSCFMSRRSPAR